ncbi:hypothetical protein RE476_02915 [Methanolobus mangrovi]|uniref:Uncharacterized protein n=1 Tax=Methanolobus mangrovi TaxID=3072977 RepID=A0AA51UGJ6_9EURY|nr:hypothetical protein [Methanolobus mangrovi]WMW22791.1 hypothetical protein RE476_02915 [Methanolobus mangrovi]
MKLKLFPLYLILILLTCLVAGCVDEQVKSEDDTNAATVDEAEFAQIMAEANSAYIKALVSTSQKNTSASEASINLLVEKLTYVSETYGQAPPEMYANDKNWTSEIKRAVLIAAYSQEMLASGDIEAAHTALEPMRDLFFSLHERNGVIHMGDLLTVFHASMEEAITFANANDTERVASYIPTLEQEWQDVKDADKPASADEEYEQTLAQVDSAIGVLNSSIINGDSAEIRTNAENLRLAFARVFAKYGVVIS